jgi:hypothetical protein
MTNLELIVALLERHRYARAWDDTAVGRDLLERFGLDPAGVAANPLVVGDPNAVTEDEVVAAELAAHDAVKLAADKRAALNAQTGDTSHIDDADAQPPAPSQTEQAHPIPPMAFETHAE